MAADEDAEIVHLLLAGAAEDNEFTPGEFFEHVDVIEAYRVGDAPPEFDQS